MGKLDAILPVCETIALTCTEVRYAAGVRVQCLLSDLNRCSYISVVGTR
jgi:hypothetical protein